MSDFANRLISLMMVGEKKKAFAERIGVSANQLSRYLGGQIPRLETIEKIVINTRCDRNWLLAGEGDAYFANPTDIDKEMWDEAEKTADQGGPGPPFDPGQVRMLGAKTTRRVSDKVRAQLAAGWWEAMQDIGKEEREAMADLIKDAQADPDLRLILLDQYRFLTWRKRQRKGSPK